LSFLAWSLIGLIRSGTIQENPILLLFFLLKIIGFSVSTLFIWSEMGKSNGTLQKFCKDGKKVSCNEVVHSRHSKILGVFSFSALIFSYYFSSLLTLAITGFSSSEFSLLSYISLLSLPFIVYSIYLQGRVLKKWCKLCLIISSLLSLEIAIVILLGITHIVFDVKDYFIFYVVFLCFSFGV